MAAFQPSKKPIGSPAAAASKTGDENRAALSAITVFLNRPMANITTPINRFSRQNRPRFRPKN